MRRCWRSRSTGGRERRDCPVWCALCAGGMYKFEPNGVNADLGTTAKATSSEGKLHVVLVPKANPDWIKVGQLERVASWE